MRSSFLTLAALTAATIAGTFFATTRADACAGLIGSNGAVNLGRTTTLAAYANGEEHYVTSFEFQGSGGGEFGTLIPLPGVPSNIERGGAWTLQRLQLETTPQEALFRPLAAADAAGASRSVEVLIETRVDALDLTVLKGGGPAVAAWAEEHGFRLSPDAPEVLDFYAERSPIFLAAVFDGDAALERGQQAGDGTPVHLTIPTDNPWVPLRILALGKQPSDRVEADVFLLTEAKPNILPGLRKGLTLLHSDPATGLLLSDLRSDDGMAWVPGEMWLTKIGIDARARDLDFDLAVEADGVGSPSRVDAGLEPPSQSIGPDSAFQDDGDNGLVRNLAALAVIGAGVLAGSIVIAKYHPVRRLPR